MEWWLRVAPRIGCWRHRVRGVPQVGLQCFPDAPLPVLGQLHWGH